MKKIMILMAGALTVGTAAQAQISIAPEIGLNLANMHGKYTDASGAEQKNDGGIKLGVKVGANVNIPIGDRLVIQPGLFYSIKGYKESSDESTTTTIGTDTYTTTTSTNDNVTMHWFDIPVNFQYNFNDPGEGRFFIGVGPYMAVAFSGQDKYSSSVSSNIPGFPGGGGSGTYKYKFGNDEPSNDLRRFDFGGQVNAGYQLRSGIFFRGMYQAGIANLYPQGNRPAGSGDATLRQTNITISIGYALGSKK